MNLITEFRAIVAGFGSPQPEFIYANLPRAVELLDNIIGSTVLYIEPSEGFILSDMSGVGTGWKVEIAFIEIVAGSVDNDIEAETRYTSIAIAIANAHKFIEAYNKSKKFDLLMGNIEMIRIPENFSNAVITGVILTFDCKPTDFICA